MGRESVSSVPSGPSAPGGGLICYLRDSHPIPRGIFNLVKRMVSYQVKQKLDLRGEALPRTPGIHLSGILRRLAFINGWMDKKWDTEETLEDLITRTPADEIGLNGNLMRLVLGMSVEEWIAKQLVALRPGFIHQPGEYSLDGILMTPDGIEFDDDGILIHEIKGTHKSAKKPITEQRLYIWQGACYLRAVSEYFHEKAVRCMFHPFFIRGDYSGIDPLYLPQLVIFEWEEILSMWNVVMEHKHLAEPEKGQS